MSEQSLKMGPWSLISFLENGAKEEPETSIQPMVNEMIVIHNCLIRSINAIYLQCINIEKSPQDIPDFLAYCSVWGKFVHEHHKGEEDCVFPDIEQKTGVAGLMAGNIAQHDAFHEGVEQYEAYVEEVKSGRTQYDGRRFRGIIESFGPTLHQHLVEEIPTLLSLKQYSEQVDWAGYWQKKSAEIIKMASSDPQAKAIMMPFCLSCHDPNFEEGAVSWPAMPWVAKMLFKYYFVPQHKNWWRFGPIDANGKPQELPFA
ncbi:putative hemerythrin hhe cation binding domain-containing protein [Seiridium unicorne]|uniref:Hemerythrin hhe cation binding domain-containing protein n=1 Tax=Seiridium unicorne TaxID=138068 RepID=A0ABR2V6Y4_9PEZI